MNMPGVGIQITPENCERLKEYSCDMNVTLNEALNHALQYFFATVGFAEREHKAEQAIQDTIARRGMS
jgi:hypothetical protein